MQLFAWQELGQKLVDSLLQPLPTSSTPFGTETPSDWSHCSFHTSQHHGLAKADAHILPTIPPKLPFNYPIVASRHHHKVRNQPPPPDRMGKIVRFQDRLQLEIDWPLIGAISIEIGGHRLSACWGVPLLHTDTCFICLQRSVLDRFGGFWRCASGRATQATNCLPTAATCEPATCYLQGQQHRSWRWWNRTASALDGCTTFTKCLIDMTGNRWCGGVEVWRAFLGSISWAGIWDGWMTDWHPHFASDSRPPPQKAKKDPDDLEFLGVRTYSFMFNTRYVRRCGWTCPSGEWPWVYNRLVLPHTSRPRRCHSVLCVPSRTNNSWPAPLCKKGF